MIKPKRRNHLLAVVRFENLLFALQLITKPASGNWICTRNRRSLSASNGRGPSNRVFFIDLLGIFIIIITTAITTLLWLIVYILCKRQCLVGTSFQRNGFVCTGRYLRSIFIQKERQTERILFIKEREQFFRFLLVDIFYIATTYLLGSVRQVSLIKELVPFLVL